MGPPPRQLPRRDSKRVSGRRWGATADKKGEGFGSCPVRRLQAQIRAVSRFDIVWMLRQKEDALDWFHPTGRSFYIDDQIQHR